MKIGPRQKNRLHFIGIGGIGMSGIAEVFLNQGYHVTGSDIANSETVKKLSELGAKIYMGHSAENVSQAQVVIISSAISQSNPEVVQAKKLRIPVIPRAEMLGELMRGKLGIAVAGSHGKTTTTSMLASILVAGKIDPTIVIGGKVDSLGGHAQAGQGEVVVAEADESDGSFTHLPAQVGVVTNIDNDHLDFFGSQELIERAFLDFIGKIPFYGFCVVCTEDPGVKACINKMTKPILTYGFSENCDYFIKNLKLSGMGSEFHVIKRSTSEDHNKDLGTIKLFIPGKHNALNAMAAIVVADQMGVSFCDIQKGLMTLRGIKRRFEVIWQDHDRMVVDDYGHHPSEIEATLVAARSFWPGKIKVVFQPHRYSRTKNCFNDFSKAFQLADELYITDVYSAGEEPIEGFDSKSLVDTIIKENKRINKIMHLDDNVIVSEFISNEFQSNDLIICMGAGTITQLPQNILQRINLKNKNTSQVNVNI